MKVSYEWDEIKRLRNFHKHGVDFSDCPMILEDPRSLTIIDDRFDYDEHRFHTFGWLLDELIVIAYTEREGRLRIISARKALKHEQKGYLRHFGFQ